MNIVVCIKQVPDVPNIRIDRERMTIIRDGIESIINPLDSIALEAALDLKQKEGGKISVVTMGPSQSEEALREALAAGADEAILLSDPGFAGADTLVTSKVIASAISRLILPRPESSAGSRPRTAIPTRGSSACQRAQLAAGLRVNGTMEMNARGQQLSDGFQNTRVSFPPLTVSAGLTFPAHPPGDLGAGVFKRPCDSMGLKDLNLRPEEVDSGSMIPLSGFTGRLRRERV
jgi:hypothetical protein